MGVKKYVLLSPYMKVSGTIKEETVVVDRICPNHPRQKQGNAKFCPDCGGEIQSVDRPVSRELSPQSVLQRHKDYKEDHLSFNDYCDVILPNLRPPHHFNFPDERACSVNLIGINHKIVAQLEWFKEEYAKEIAVLVEAFGDDYVEINWGVVVYYA